MVTSWTFAAAIGLTARDVVATGAVGGPTRTSSSYTLAGRILLPAGAGSRGVEIIATVADPGDGPRRVWLLFDENGRFRHELEGDLVRVIVSTGLRTELHRIDWEALPEVDATGEIDVGEIDLRDKLVPHRLVLRPAAAVKPGEARVAMFFGLPPSGPYGEPISLGSRQFPPVALGSELEWLLPPEAQCVYFLVERPADSGEWRWGAQYLFGPFSSDTLPAELVLDDEGT